MTATVVSFGIRFPEFCDVDDDRVQLFLDDAALLMGTDDGRWLDFYSVAHAYHAAHLLTAGEASESGDYGILAPVKRQEVDDVVIESAIGNISATADDYFSTTYGKRYIHYRKICFMGPVGV